MKIDLRQVIDPLNKPAWKSHACAVVISVMTSQVREGSIGTVEIAGTDTLSVLWARIQELYDYPAATTRLVHMGKILTLVKDGESSASMLADVPVQGSCG